VFVVAEREDDKTDKSLSRYLIILLGFLLIMSFAAVCIKPVRAAYDVAICLGNTITGGSQIHPYTVVAAAIPRRDSILLTLSRLDWYQLLQCSSVDSRGTRLSSEHRRHRHPSGL